MILQTPGLYTKEKEISVIQTDANRSTVLSVLTTKNGMAMEEVLVNNVDEFVEHFGEPTDYNYKEWYQVWNFLQYSSPITVIRLLNTTSTGQATVGSIRFDYDTDHHDKVFNNQSDLYNNHTGIETISDYALDSLHTLQIFNRFVSNEENVAISICSNETDFQQAFSFEKILYNDNSTITEYDPTTNTPISKQNIWFDSSKEKEYYKESGTDKILKHHFDFEYKTIGSDTYRMAFDSSLQNYETGDCITFRQLFNSDVTINFSDGYFLLVIFKYNKETKVFNQVEQYVLNYNINKRIGGLSYSQIQNMINDASTNIWISINKDLDFDDINTYTRVQTISTNSETILSNVLRNDYSTKQLNIKYDLNTYQMNSSIQEIVDKYSDFNYMSNLRYIIPILKINQNGTINLETASDLAITRSSCMNIMTIWNETDLKLEKTDIGKIETISKYLGTASRDNIQYTNKNTYTACYDNIKYQSDDYNNKNRWIPLSGDIIGIIDQFDKTVNAYDIPAGYSTTPIKNVIKMMYELKDVKLKDRLANESINIIIKDETGSWRLFDMLTNISGDSLFKKMNVRRVTLEVKKIIQRNTKQVFFGINDVEERTELLLRLNREMSEINGLEDFNVICNDRNNSQSDINNMILNIDIFIQPRNYIRVINLRINITKNSLANITELEV